MQFCYMPWSGATDAISILRQRINKLDFKRHPRVSQNLSVTNTYSVVATHDTKPQ